MRPGTTGEPGCSYARRQHCENLFAMEPIRIRSIQFHREGQTPTFPLRRNATLGSVIEPPEWQAGRLFEQQGGVAFVAELVKAGRKPTATVVFERKVIEQALTVTASAAAIRHGTAPILGDLAKQRVTFAAGESQARCQFELNSAHLNAVGTGDVQWEWRLENGVGGLSMERTLHRVYVLLGEPQLPWSSNPAQLPWMDLLDLVCLKKWAGGTRRFQDAQNRITRRFNRMGDHGELVYEGAHSFFLHSPNGVTSLLQCTDLLRELGDGLPTSVDCQDSATAVTAFCNVLGCNLSISRITPAKAGEVIVLEKSVRAVGSGPLPKTFGFHEVALLDKRFRRKGRPDMVWDGSLQVDVVLGRRTAIRVPSSISFPGYLRALTTTPVEQAPKVPRSALVEMPGERSEDSRSAADAASPFMIGSLFDGFTIPGFERWDPPGAFGASTTSRWRGPSGWILVQAQPAESFDVAKRLMDDFHPQVTTPLLKLNGSFQQALLTESRDTLFFRRGNLVCRISRYRSEAGLDVEKIARQLDNQLTLTAGHPGAGHGIDLSTLPPPGPENRVFYRLIAPQGTFVRKDGKIGFDGDPKSLQIFQHHIGPSVVRHSLG